MNKITFLDGKKMIICTAIFVSCVLLSCNQTTTKETMNNTLETIHNRTSVRRYTDQVVPKEKIEILLKAAMAAPSSKNNQPWSFYVITNREVLTKLAEQLPFAKMLAKAPLAIVVCGDNTKGVVNPERSLNWALDCSAASQNLLLAAEAEGLGAVWTGVFPYSDRVKAVQESLRLPENIMPLNIIPVGYPDGEHMPKDKFNPDVISWIE
jgi:nitroreductase